MNLVGEEGLRVDLDKLPSNMPSVQLKREYIYSDHLPTKGKHYYARADENGHVALPEGVQPGDEIQVTVQYEVPDHNYLRIPKLEPTRLPRNQRIPHLQRGGYRR
ncbi:hypothetical protein D3C87_860130 [compost metagenome]